MHIPASKLANQFNYNSLIRINFLHLEVKIEFFRIQVFASENPLLALHCAGMSNTYFIRQKRE